MHVRERLVITVVDAIQHSTQQPIGTILDIGANVVQFSSGQVVNAGVGDHSGSAQLHYLPGRSGQGSLEVGNASRSVWKAHDSDVRTAEVELVTGDWIAKKHSTEWDLIKIDVEGHERSVLTGLTNLRWRYLLIEVSPGRGGIDDEADLESLLTSQGIEIEALTVIESSATGKDVLVRRRS